MADIDKLEEQIASALRTVSPVIAKSLLRQSIKSAMTSLDDDGSDVKLALLASSALSDLAAIENRPNERRALRRQAITVCEKAFAASSHASLAAAFANRVVDLFYDGLARDDFIEAQRKLAQAKSVLDRSARLETDSTTLATLLCQRSSVLRCQALIEKKSLRQPLSQEAVRCANRAVAECPNAEFTYLELGQARWSAARWAATEEQYFSEMHKAEEALTRAADTAFPLGLLVLARFYRHTYRPLQSVECFLAFERKDSLRRRVLSESFLIGEAAIRLSYGQYSSASIKRGQQEAIRLLHESISAGYDNARIYTALAFLEAYQGNQKGSESLLRNLATAPPTSWLDGVTTASDAIFDDNYQLLQTAFVLGMTDGNVWNSLGTYCVTFVQDLLLAQRFYEAGLRLDPDNPVLLTNLARLLIQTHKEEVLDRADRLLQAASQNADRAFVWWRAVRTQLQIARRGVPVPDKVVPIYKRSEPPTFKGLRELYHSISTMDASLKGQEFQLLIEMLLKLTFGARAFGSQHVHDRQVDSGFWFESHYYRVEVKCEKEPCGPDVVDQLRGRLITAEVRGMIVSFSGFTDGAIQAATQFGFEKTVILMDGEELAPVLDGTIRFEMLIESKIDRFYREGNPYARVTREQLNAGPWSMSTCG